jgi:hypothetical protein
MAKHAITVQAAEMCIFIGLLIKCFINDSVTDVTLYLVTRNWEICTSMLTYRVLLAPPLGIARSKGPKQCTHTRKGLRFFHEMLLYIYFPLLTHLLYRTSSSWLTLRHHISRQQHKLGYPAQVMDTGTSEYEYGSRISTL